MMKNRFPLLLAVLCATSYGSLRSQTFSVDDYEAFLHENASITSTELESLHDAGLFKAGAPTSFDNCQYSTEIDNVFSLTQYEKSLIDRNGFMVTQRSPFYSFGDAFHNVYIKDLPVFVSTDAILHALHKSYDEILKDVETSTLIPELSSMLSDMRGRLPALAKKYSERREMLTSLNDVDVYLTVADRLLTAPDAAAIDPVFSPNAATVDEFMEYIAAESPAGVTMFGEVPRTYDFSQFTVLGHYTDSPDLGRYFQAMIWIGRTEIYLSETAGSLNPPSPEDVKRQTVMAALLSEAARDGDAFAELATIDRTLGFMIGESDNVSLTNVLELMEEANIPDASGLLDDQALKRFQRALADKPYAEQRILSQILFSDPLSPDKIQPASAMLMLGQRFVIDSYVMANVVYDKVSSPPRILPSSLDVLFALGNNAALHLLEPEIDRYNYAKQLAGLRYLIDSYEPSYWNSTLYTGWLGAIRALNPPGDRKGLPQFMQTTAWWQEKMNTQLASWAQLRHDNLLYAKQSYSGGIGCSYPKGYVEPIPAFYEAVAAYADRGEEVFSDMGNEAVAGYFANLSETCGKLADIARKELTNSTLTSDEEEFLSTLLSQKSVVCGVVQYDGWYPKLFYRNYLDRGAKDVVEQDLIVADVHTAPTDAEGNPVGWVMHVGTGMVNLAVVTCTDAEGNGTAYVGPVMSYHEHVTTNFERLTDEDWAETALQRESARPDWTNVYLAGMDGGPRGEVVTLKTEVSGVDDRAAGFATGTSLKSRVFPNPTAGASTFSFAVPPSLAGEEVTIVLFDAEGKPVTELLRQTLPAGTYMTRWDGTDAGGVGVAVGTYFYTISAGQARESGKLERVSAGSR